MKKIKLKMFHVEVLNDHEQLSKETGECGDLPQVAEVNHQQVMDTFYQVKMEVRKLISKEVEKLKVENG